MLVIHPKRGKELRPFGWVLLACVWFVSGTWMVPSWAAVTDSTPWSLLTEEGKWEVWWDAASIWVFPKIGVKPRKMHGENNGTPNLKKNGSCGGISYYFRKHPYLAGGFSPFEKDSSNCSHPGSESQWNTATYTPSSVHRRRNISQIGSFPQGSGWK